MSIHVTCKCDHCGAELSTHINKHWHTSFLTIGPNIDDVHACSKEHMGLALAETFGLSIDGKAMATIAALQAQIKDCDATIKRYQNGTATHIDVVAKKNAYIAELEAQVKLLGASLQQSAHDVKRITELEARLAEVTKVPTVEGKTPGQFLRSVFDSFPGELSCDDAHEDAAQAVLRAFGGGADALRCMECNGRGEVPVTCPDGMKGLVGDCNVCKGTGIINSELANLPQSPPDTSTESGLPDPALAAMGATNITDPKKPTKPLLTQFVNAPIANRLEALVLYWEKGAAHETLSEEYRSGLATCAKELREVLQ